MTYRVTNIVQLQHNNTELLQKAVTGFNSTGLLRALLPIPRELIVDIDVDDENIDDIRATNKLTFGYADSYEFRVAEWHCTSDIDSTRLKAEVTGDTAVLEFDTMLHSPVDVFDRLLDFGFDIVAYYYEPRLGFCGVWDNGVNYSFDISGYPAAVVRNFIDPTLDDVFGITDSIIEFEEEEFA